MSDMYTSIDSSGIHCEMRDDWTSEQQVCLCIVTNRVDERLLIARWTQESDCIEHAALRAISRNTMMLEGKARDKEQHTESRKHRENRIEPKQSSGKSNEHCQVCEDGQVHSSDRATPCVHQGPDGAVDVMLTGTE